MGVSGRAQGTGPQRSRGVNMGLGGLIQPWFCACGVDFRWWCFSLDGDNDDDGDNVQIDSVRVVSCGG